MLSCGRACLRTIIVMTVFGFLYLQLRLFGILNSIEEPVVVFNSETTAEIAKTVSKYNREQIILNADTFGPITNYSTIIVIQVDNRTVYLKNLIESFSQANGIGDALLIFSHNTYSEEINALVRNINFCKVMQIFYPYSVQIYPKRFPGDDPNDCSRNLSLAKALFKKCNNALYPDSYGHYREAKFTQIKHHWWWKANMIFDGLNATKYYEGPVLFLEEDHYVAKDFIYVFQKMVAELEGACKACKILGLGTYRKELNYTEDFHRVEVVSWYPSMHNMGIAFNRSTWKEIQACVNIFCKHDDYNWDWSLMQVSERCLKDRLRTMVVVAPRVLHIGECGVHHTIDRCERVKELWEAQAFLEAVKDYLYPNSLTISYVEVLVPLHWNAVHGGWADERDHRLCMAISKQYALRGVRK